MEEIREQMSAIEGPRHQSYVKYPLADILIIIMCAVLSGLDTLGDLATYAKNRGEFVGKELGIKKVPCKAAFGRILSMIDGKQIGEAIIHVLQNQLGTTGEVVAMDGKAICSTAKPGNPHSALQILSAYVTSSGIILGQESIHEKANEIPVFQEMLIYLDIEGKTVTADAMHCQRETAAGSCKAREIIYLGSKKTSLRYWRMYTCFSRIKATKMNGKSAKQWRRTQGGLKNEFAAKSRIFPG